MIYLNQFFFNIFYHIRQFYLKSKFYDKRISKIENNVLIYKPSPHLLSSLIKYHKKKYKIEDFSIEKIWDKKNVSKKDFKNLNTFYWFFSLDLKSSKTDVRSIITSWIKHNFRYEKNSWDFDLTAKRIISWLSCHHLSFDESDDEYKENFNNIILKQTNHLINEINHSKSFDDKLIGCASIILVGLCYKNEKNYLNYGLNILKKISKSSLDNYGFTKSRSIPELILYLKYFILIREWFKESQISIPEHIEETIYYLGQAYAFVWQNINQDILFNGNNISNNKNFDTYLKSLSYNFKNDSKEYSGYTVLRNKDICLIMDVGSSPNSKYSKDYQSGALSFEIIINQKKLITNCGYFKNKADLNKLSKSTAAQSTLVIDDQSSCNFYRSGNLWLINKGLKVEKKNIVHEKNYWKINASHDGYFNKYSTIHEREIEFFPEKKIFIGIDKIVKKKKNYHLKFDIRFHLEPNVKLMKTQDNKSILIELDDQGWRFTCEKFNINIDNGLYFGNKNSYKENQNIYIAGIANEKVENIKWKIEKI